MDLNEVNNMIRNLESHIQGMRQTQDNKQRYADQLENDSNELQREMAQQIAEANRIAQENDFVDTTIDSVETQYERQQEQKQRQAQQNRDEADRLSRQIAEAESVLNELKQIESYMRDYVQNAESWMNRATELMRS